MFQRARGHTGKAAYLRSPERRLSLYVLHF
jgi:hypothetical protein